MVRIKTKVKAQVSYKVKLRLFVKIKIYVYVYPDIWPWTIVGASKYITINPTLLHHQWLVVVLFSLASIWHPPSPGMRMMGWRGPGSLGCWRRF